MCRERHLTLPHHTEIQLKIVVMIIGGDGFKEESDKYMEDRLLMPVIHNGYIEPPQ